MADSLPPREQNDVVIVPDDDPYAGDDPDFLTETDVASSTQSLSSSVLNYKYENGRRYHAYREGEYLVPNDDREQDRLDLVRDQLVTIMPTTDQLFCLQHHHVCRLALGGDLFRSPIDPSEARILDLGTGTGIWAIEMGDQYPNATVIGTDLSPIQPRWVAPNCFFEVSDYESEWDFSKPFDFIHARCLGGAVKDFPRLIQRAKDHLHTDGWLEFADFAGEVFSDDGGLERAPYTMEIYKLVDEASVKFGKKQNAAPYYKQWLIEAGFKNVKEEVYKLFVTKIPLNPWPKDPKLKEIGRYQQVNMLEGLDAYTLALFTRILGWSTEQVYAYNAEVRKELVDRSLHLYGKFVWVSGQRNDRLS
ncbi:Methyltransferase [Aspergillus sclerotialis]|uniref:Methyltransferase n=1 Tax=Aspergillus sclerotialis TaxID=2070753 RepID=A0A3A2ZNY7_9EURO|nr:Methyltransferase [Aspergillus sclerotialis]